MIAHVDCNIVLTLIDPLGGQSAPRETIENKNTVFGFSRKRFI